MNIMVERKIDPRSARLANIVVYPSTNPFDGDLPGGGWLPIEEIGVLTYAT